MTQKTEDYLRNQEEWRKGKVREGLSSFDNARAKAIRLEDENERLEDENAELHGKIAAMEEEVKDRESSLCPLIEAITAIISIKNADKERIEEVGFTDCYPLDNAVDVLATEYEKYRGTP